MEKAAADEHSPSCKKDFAYKLKKAIWIVLKFIIKRVAAHARGGVGGAASRV